MKFSQEKTNNPTTKIMAECIAGKNHSSACKFTSNCMVVSGPAQLDKIAGSIDRDIDFKKEREESRDH